MERLLKKIVYIFGQGISKAFPEISEGVEITKSTQEKFGHYQCNSAMKLAKLLKLPPREVAQKIVEAVGQDPFFEKLEIAGPGFINITVSKEVLGLGVEEIVSDPHLGIPFVPKERVLIDFSCPNVAKEMHVGHLRSTIIGDTLARLFEFLGYDVLRINHIGDWGTAFGMLIAHMEEVAPKILSGQESSDLPRLMHLYRESKARFDADEAFKAKAREAVVLLQSGSEKHLQGWRVICDISRRGYSEIYALLDVKAEERGESFYNPYLVDCVEDLEKKGLITVSEGAKCVFHEGYSIPLMVQKSDGGYNYDTTDLAAMKYRIEVDKANRIIIVTDSGQSLHFKLVYETAKKAGYFDPSTFRFDHVPFGVVLGPNGKKFKTRSGDTEKLIDLLTKAIDEAKKILSQREHGMSEKEVDHLAHVLGIGAVKYSDLSCNRLQDYVFSYDKMLKFEGNTAAFILYSYVRIHGIKRRIKDFDEKKAKEAKVAVKHASEVALALELMRFADVLEAISQELFPHYLTEYLYELAEKFNLFFRDCQVIGSEEEASRVVLVLATEKTMECGLSILGLKTVERM